MRAARIPSNETERISVLQKLNILDTINEERFDRITRLAARMFSCEFSSISFIDTDRQWFKSKVNLGLCETPRSSSFCSHTILQNDVFVVPDTFANESFSDNPLVVNEPFIRFYAGIKLSIEGQHIGTLCVFDGQPNSFSKEQAQALQDLAAIVEDELKKDTKLSSTLVSHRLQKRLEEAEKLARVRDVLLEFQREFAHNPPDGKLGSILDGRDIGTVVCPDAKIKLFITASLEVRTDRRYKELQERGEEAIRSAVLDDIKTRDERDIARALSPLKPAGDAKIIDSSDFNASEVFSLAQEFIRSQMK